MNPTVPRVLSQELVLTVDPKGRRLYGFTRLNIQVPVNTRSIGLHAFQLRIRTDGIRIDGEKAAYQLREYPPEQTPEDLLQQAPPRTGDYAPAIAMDPRPPAARLAEHAFLQYQRLLQREVSEPELVIQLPNVLGDYGTMLSESADVAGVEFMELKVIIAFEALRPRCGMHFCGDWALSDNERHPGSRTGAQEVVHQVRLLVSIGDRALANTASCRILHVLPNADIRK